MWSLSIRKKRSKQLTDWLSNSKSLSACLRLTTHLRKVSFFPPFDLYVIENSIFLKMKHAVSFRQCGRCHFLWFLKELLFYVQVRLLGITLSKKNLLDCGIAARYRVSMCDSDEHIGNTDHVSSSCDVNAHASGGKNEQHHLYILGIILNYELDTLLKAESMMIVVAWGLNSIWNKNYSCVVLEIVVSLLSFVLYL